MLALVKRSLEQNVHSQSTQVEHICMTPLSRQSTPLSPVKNESPLRKNSDEISSSDSDMSASFNLKPRNQQVKSIHTIVSRNGFNIHETEQEI